MELRDLRYFLAVVEDASFTAAAERIFLSQSALSAAVARLERELGVVLLTRTSRSVQLSAAGAAFVPRAARLVADAARAVDAARRASAGEPGVLRVGLHNGTNELTGTMLGIVQAALPDLHIQMSRLDLQEAADALRERTYDVVLRSDAFETGEDVFLRLVDEPVDLLVSSTSPLADALQLEVADVLEEVFVNAGTPINELVGDTYLLGAFRGGEPARLNSTVGRNLDELLLHVRSASGVCPVDRSARPAADTSGLKQIPLVDGPTVGIGLSVRHDDRRDVIMSVVQAARAAATLLRDLAPDARRATIADHDEDDGLVRSA
jgi:DNA-binding transcriptional LysR family regulator